MHGHDGLSEVGGVFEVSAWLAGQGRCDLFDGFGRVVVCIFASSCHLNCSPNTQRVRDTPRDIPTQSPMKNNCLPVSSVQLGLVIIELYQAVFNISIVTDQLPDPGPGEIDLAYSFNI